MIERIHLSDFARLEAVDVRKRDRRRRIEGGSCRLYRDDEAWLLAEPWYHRYFVAVHDGDADAAFLGTTGEGDLTGPDCQRKTRRFWNCERPPSRGRGDAERIRRI